MKLRADQIVAPDHRGKRPAVIGDRRAGRRHRRAGNGSCERNRRGAARPSPSSTGCSRRGARSFQPMCGIFSAGSTGCDRARRRRRSSPRPSVVSNSRPRSRHQLHADADAEKRPAAADHRLDQRRFQARAPRQDPAGNRQRRRPRAARSARRRRPRPAGWSRRSVRPIPASAAARSNALAAERRLPEP